MCPCSGGGTREDRRRWAIRGQAGQMVQYTRVSLLCVWALLSPIFTVHLPAPFRSYCTSTPVPWRHATRSPTLTETGASRMLPASLLENVSTLAPGVGTQKPRAENTGQVGGHRRPYKSCVLIATTCHLPTCTLHSPSPSRSYCKSSPVPLRQMTSWPTSI